MSPRRHGVSLHHKPTAFPHHSGGAPWAFTLGKPPRTGASAPVPAPTTTLVKKHGPAFGNVSALSWEARLWLTGCSFRRAFATLLYGVGTSDAVITRLMRHAHGITQARYIDPDPTMERAAVENLPTIFPESETSEDQRVSVSHREWNVKKAPASVADREKSRYLPHATFEAHDNTTPDPVPPLERRTLSQQAPGSGVALSGEHRPGQKASAARRGSPSGGPRDGNSIHSGPQMPICASQMDRVLNLLAESHAGLVAIAGRLGQTEVRHGDGADSED